MIPYEEPLINVGILVDKRIKFELYGDFNVTGYNETFSGVFTAEVKDDKLICKSKKNKIEVEDQLTFQPTNPISESFLIRDVIIGLKFHWERREKQRFNFALKLVKEKDEIAAINVLPLERYLTSVISSEMSAKSSIELLKAQAVVARSWILAQMEKVNEVISKKENQKATVQLENKIIKWYDHEEHKLFDVCADDHCQRFQGVTKIISESAHNAIEQTKGIVLLSNNSICDTRYSKCCGGISESFEHVWEAVKHDYLTSVIDYKYEPEIYKIDFAKEENARKWILGNPPSYCNTSDTKILSHILVDYDRETKDFYRWKIEYTQNELAHIINENMEIDFGEITDLIPLERGYSARISRLKIVGTKKTLVIGKELEIRRVLSKSHLYSSAFIVEKVGNNIPSKFILHGAGWGHGVGLCQIGAAVMAEMGFHFDEILLHYFSHTWLKRIY
ncbi:MAG: SpoIID/LytB domain-containing protein [Ignavibacteria bacterium]|nr:SpoIID/LytB domain-containing protein [Ignavibacteria bacterium]MBT8382009.1 SpoIID/LytB domain-containing protein [Ignavibacteria bacterium]MBT8390801.1 SpoIID/LytB domain-containing protein [Ignavibacteria bacterium]NNJ52303.1 SpoIID/LytB domain-containing protein [Ignavibacteriaceae bacterium]NNL20173.1 SpoIID/LytB domain-containing protein [Ignavibacteriaceae bacterium]